MKEKETFYAVLHIESEGWISRYTEKTKRVYLVKNPYSSNYFIAYHLAETWLHESGLPQEDFCILGFK